MKLMFFAFLVFSSSAFSATVNCYGKLSLEGRMSGTHTVDVTNLRINSDGKSGHLGQVFFYYMSNPSICHTWLNLESRPCDNNEKGCFVLSAKSCQTAWYEGDVLTFKVNLNSSSPDELIHQKLGGGRETSKYTGKLVCR